MSVQTNTVIIGSGIIGTATAFYLAQSGQTLPQTIHLIEAAPQLFASASGKAGGFIVRDWFGPATASLGALSYDLHKSLAKQHNGAERWGFSRSSGMSLIDDSTVTDGSRGEDWLVQGGSRAGDAGPRLSRDAGSSGNNPPWLSLQHGGRTESIAEQGSAIQVDPLKLCEFLLSECKKLGVHVHHPAKALSVSKDMHDELAAIRIAENGSEEVDLPCTKLVLTAGAWTPRVFETLFPDSPLRVPVSPLAGHSLVARSSQWQVEHELHGCHAIFTTDESGHSPEIFSRIGGEIYIAGVNQPNLDLPKVATDALPDSAHIETLRRIAKKHLGVIADDDLEVVREGLCFRPITAKGPPIVSRVQDKDLGNFKTRGGGDGGVFIAAGHGPWGISQSLGTGKVLSELVEGQQPSADVRYLQI